MPRFSPKLPVLPVYLVKEIVPLCLASFAILTTLVFCQQLSRNSELFFSPLINWQILAYILASLLPPIITFTLPLAIVIGEVLTLSRLAADHEWGALEAGGLNRVTRYGPYLFVGLAGFVMVLVLNWNTAPQAIAKLKEVRNSLTLDKATTQIRPQTFISEFPGLLIKVQAVDRQTGKWDGVLLLRKDEVTAKLQLLAAKSGSLAPIDDKLSSFEIKLSNGVFIDNLLSAKTHVTSVFKESTIKISPAKPPAEILSAETASAVQSSAMGVLLSRLKQARADGNRNSSEIEIEVYKRFANSFACVFASLCALVLTSQLYGRSAKRQLLILGSFILLVTFYAALTYGQNLALRGKITGQQGILLGCAIPCLILVLLKWIMSKNLISFHKFFQLAARPQKPMPVIAKPTSIAANTKLPSVNLGHYLVLSQFVKLLTLTMVILIATILLFTLIDIAPSIAKNNVSLDFALGYLVRLSPQIGYYIAPFAILVATVAAASVLAKTGQLTILLYYVSSPMRLALPIILGALLIYLSVLLLSDVILPYSNRQQDNRYRAIKGKSLEEVTVAFDRQWVFNESSASIYGYQLVGDIGNQKMNALVFKLTNPNYYLREVLHFDAIELQQKDSDASTSFRYIVNDDGLTKLDFLNPGDLPLDLKNRDVMHERTYHEASKMTFKQLQTYISQVEKTGLSTTGLRMEKAQKIAFPFACITLLFLAFPVCLLQIRRQYQSRFSSIAISIALALLFWGLLSVFEAAGKRGTIPISIAAWSPHALFLALATTIQLKLHHP